MDLAYDGVLTNCLHIAAKYGVGQRGERGRERGGEGEDGRERRGGGLYFSVGLIL